jgi:hypothetical protein
LRKAGHQLAQSEPIAAVAAKADDNGEIIWGNAPAQARLIFVLEAPALDKTGRPYRLAKMVTTAATPAQAAYFRHNRSSLFGQLQPDGTIHKISPLTPPAGTSRAGRVILKRSPCKTSASCRARADQ